MLRDLKNLSDGKFHSCHCKGLPLNCESFNPGKELFFLLVLASSDFLIYCTISDEGQGVICGGPLQYKGAGTVCGLLVHQNY